MKIKIQLANFLNQNSPPHIMEVGILKGEEKPLREFINIW